MPTIVTTRAGKGTPLTNAEVDTNFSTLATAVDTKQDSATALTPSGVGILDNKTLSASCNVSAASGQPFSFRNKLINGNFGINQRGVAGTVVLSAWQYGHDRFKAGAGGCTYTFATVANVTTITITAGTLMQEIEGSNLQSGTHVLSWQGTAQGRINPGNYGASGLTGTAVGGTNQTCEWNTGTLKLAQYEPGTIPSVFEYRMNELQLCQRYYQRVRTYLSGYNGNGGNIMFYSPLVYAPMRTVVSGVLVTEHTISNIAASGRALVGQADNSGYSSAQALATGSYICDRTYALETEL